MAIGLTGSPQELTPGYNPVYWYADSPNTGLNSFRYLFKITNVSSGEELADLKIKPRFGDDLMEVNISKILDSNLGPASDDFNLNDPTLYGFNNTVSSGFKYSIELGEEYEYSWVFDDTNYSSGKVRLISTTESSYNVGDTINVQGAAEYFDFTDNQFDSGQVGFLTVDNLSGVINIGDTIEVQQSPGFTYPQYNGSFTVSSVSSTVVTVNNTYQGDTPPEGGTFIRNFNYDGLGRVSDIGTVSGGYYIEYDQPWVDSTGTNPGTVVYADGRVESNPSIITEDDYYVFNGASSHKDWLNWDFTQYDPNVPFGRFLTTVPDNYEVSLDNDIFLNIWGNRGFGSMFNLRVITYDYNDDIIQTYNILNPNLNPDQTEIQNISLGPRGLNNAVTDIVLNGHFSTTYSWTLVDTLTATSSIVGGSLKYEDSVGDGESIAWQYDLLTIGCEYLVTLTTTSNTSVVVSIGDENDSYTIVPIGNDGTYTQSFTPTGTDFQITMTPGIAGVNSTFIDNVTVQPLCPMINCDVSLYTAQVTISFITQSDVYSFPVDCLCEGRYTNYPILFMDRFGSFIPFNFSLNNKQSVGVKRDKYNKFIGGLNSGSYTYDTTEHSSRIYNVDLEELWELNTDYMTETLSIYFEELISSPIAFILIDGQYEAINIMNKKYKRKMKNNTKLRRYTIEIGKSNNNTINI